MSVPEALELVRNSEFHSWPVVDNRGVLGVVARATLQQALADRAGPKTVAALMSPSLFPHVHPDHSLHLALERMGIAGVDLLPVVSRANVRTPLGIVALSDVMSAYGLTNWQRMSPTSTPQQES